jgi:hypothetical protein
VESKALNSHTDYHFASEYEVECVVLEGLFGEKAVPEVVVGTQGL